MVKEIVKVYDWKVSLWKGIKQILIFGIPFVITAWLNFHPEISSLTIGAVANILINFIKNKSK